MADCGHDDANDIVVRSLANETIQQSTSDFRTAQHFIQPTAKGRRDEGMEGRRDEGTKRRRDEETTTATLMRMQIPQSKQ